MPQRKSTIVSPAPAMGGLARAQKLSPEQRRQIAQLAAAVRWAGHEGPPIQATHVGTLVIGEAELDCAVLEDGRRVLSQRGVNRALGRKHAAATSRPRGRPVMAVENCPSFSPQRV